MIFAVRKPEFVPFVALRQDVRGRREVAHSVSGAALVGSIRLRAMNQAGFMQAALIGLKREVHGFVLVYHFRLNL